LAPGSKNINPVEIGAIGPTMFAIIVVRILILLVFAALAATGRITRKRLGVAHRGRRSSRAYTFSTTFSSALREVSVEYILPFGSRQWVSSVKVSW
jgi:hypothetical protein